MKLNKTTGKYLHKRALEKWLPRTVVWRKKKGFANPVEHWFRRQMRPFVEECLLAPDSAAATFFDRLRDWLDRPVTLVLLGAFALCSLYLVLLRRRAVRRRQRRRSGRGAPVA